MSGLPIPVIGLRAYEEIKSLERGERENVTCPNCNLDTGEYIYTSNKVSHSGHNLSGQRFAFVVVERWRCSSCNFVWVYKYGVNEPDEWRE